MTAVSLLIVLLINMGKHSTLELRKQKRICTVVYQKFFVKSSEQEIILREMFVWSAVAGCDSHRVLSRQHPSHECH